MIAPPPLHPGDTIGVMAPSSRIAPEDLDAGAAMLRARGFNAFIHPQCYSGNRQTPDGRFTQYAGTPEEKVGAFHDLIRDPEIQAIFFATGGQGCLKFIDLIDYGLIAANPKILLGFSDLTALLNSVTARTGLITYHGPTLKRLLTNNQLDFNFRLLAGEERKIPLGGATMLNPGSATGLLIGGNLSLVAALRDDDLALPDGAILCLEDIKEEITAVDRQLTILRRRGLLSRVAALVFGQFTDLTDTGTPFGMGLDDLIATYTAGLGIPVLTNAAFGHGDDLPVFPIGQKVTLENDFICLDPLPVL